MVCIIYTLNLVSAYSQISAGCRFAYKLSTPGISRCRRERLMFAVHMADGQEDICSDPALFLYRIDQIL